MKNRYIKLFENNIIELNIDNQTLPIMIIKKEDWPQGKNDPTQYSSDNNCVQVRDDYNYKSDNKGWMRHEFVHYVLDKQNFKDDNKEYPLNAVEKKAYTYQFKYLKDKGYKNYEDVGLEKDSYTKILKNYWDKA